MQLSWLKIENLLESDIYPASVLLAQSMSTNPNHISIFGSPLPPAIEKQRKMFEMVLRNPNNESCIVKIHGDIVGTMTFTTSDSCQVSALAVIAFLPGYLRMFGSSLIPALKWRKNWARHDLPFPHIHFGPLAVRKDYQGKGIGKLLLSRFCQYLDDSGKIGYLETDKQENVALYEKFDFEVIETDKLFGSANWFMMRRAKHS